MKLQLSQKGWALLCVAGAGIVLSIVYIVIALQYPIGSLAEPARGFYPIGVGSLLFIASVCAFVVAFFETSQGKLEWPRGASLWRILAIIAAIFSYMIILPRAGNVVALVIVVFITLQVMGSYRWYLNIGLSIVIAIGSHYLFSTLLKVPFPRGTWFS